MNGYLLDTEVLAEIVRKRPSEEVLRRLRKARPHELTTSATCVTELRCGAARQGDGGALWDRIQGEILAKVRILPLGEPEARCAGDLLAVLESQGETIGLEYVLVGATALVNELTVATRNTTHFVRIDGLVVENWWTS